MLDLDALFGMAFWCRREIIAWFSSSEKGLKRNVLIYFIISCSHDTLCVLCIIQVKKSSSMIATEYVMCMQFVGVNKKLQS